MKLATWVQYKRGSDGGFFMDLPKNLTYEEICTLAQDRKTWKRMTKLVGDLPAMARYISMKLPRPQPASTTSASTPTTTELPTPTPTPSSPPTTTPRQRHEAQPRQHHLNRIKRPVRRRLLLPPPPAKVIPTPLSTTTPPPASTRTVSPPLLPTPTTSPRTRRERQMALLRQISRKRFVRPKQKPEPKPTLRTAQAAPPTPTSSDMTSTPSDVIFVPSSPRTRDGSLWAEPAISPSDYSTPSNISKHLDATPTDPPDDCKTCSPPTPSTISLTTNPATTLSLSPFPLSLSPIPTINDLNQSLFPH